MDGKQKWAELGGRTGCLPSRAWFRCRPHQLQLTLPQKGGKKGEEWPCLTRNPCNGCGGWPQHLFLPFSCEFTIVRVEKLQSYIL